MLTIKTKEEMRATTGDWRSQNQTIALVPTMGALHKGHLSLIAVAREQARRVVVSVFVNPTQFGPNEDFARYPRDLDGDLAKCVQAGADAIFVPSAREMYAEQATTFVTEDSLSRHLCGAVRPGHFRGVLTVVAKLLNIVSPDLAIFGSKDFQQLALIRRMVRDLDMPVSIIAAPTLREADGLAMSSRNRYLSTSQRHSAGKLWLALQAARQAWEDGLVDANALRELILRDLAYDSSIHVEYAEVVNSDSLQPVAHAVAGTLVAIAAKVGETRLIDNLVLGQ